jgi:hypothetical protein
MTHWLNRASAMLREEGLCSRGEPDATAIDRRWLWRLEGFLAVSGTNPGHRQMGSDLRQYLNETCVHHWHACAAEGEIEAHRQCLYCKDVQWGQLDSSHPASSRTDTKP